MSLTNNILERRPDETVFDYHKRIIDGKLVDKTLSDYDYTELAELVYGQPYSADVARRMFYGSKRTLDTIEREQVYSVSDSDKLNEIESKIYEMQKERQRCADQRRELKKLVNSDGRMDNLYDRLSQAAFELNNTIGNIYSEPLVLEYSDNEAILVLSDWHYGMTADNIFNKYDTNICLNRVRNITAKAASRIRLHSCKKLHVVVLGDLVHGAIHVSARVASEELVSDQLMQVSEILAQSIEELSKYVEETLVYVTYGNHARTIQNKKDSAHRDNMERLIPWWLSARLGRYDNIHIMPESENELIVMSVCGHDGFAAHGDLDTIGRSPKIIANILNKKMGVNIEWAIFGDKHHRETDDEAGIYSMICGSLSGTDDYANEKRLFSPPSQLLLIVNNECGIDAEYALGC